jgi:hypothetical protein
LAASAEADRLQREVTLDVYGALAPLKAALEDSAHVQPTASGR